MPTNWVRVRILDPYAVPGFEGKAQLHCHTSCSDGYLHPAEAAERYRQAGYVFLAITDHDRITSVEGLSDPGFCVVPGVERTVPRPVRPLGPHLSCLLVTRLPRGRAAQGIVADTVAQGGVCCLNHPSWAGNLGTARWTARAMRFLRGYHLVEIWNPHSDWEEDVRRWAAACRYHGPDHPIAPVAADDLHRPEGFDRAWVVVRAETLSPEGLRRALLRGSVYASTGPQARFGVRDGVVFAETDARLIRFYDARGELRHEGVGPEAEYEPRPEDGFVRVECVGLCEARAWSNVFWVLPAGA